MFGVAVRFEERAMIGGGSGKRLDTVRCRCVTLTLPKSRVEIPRTNRGRCVERSECALHCCLDRALDGPALEKAYLCLCGMNVHVDAGDRKTDG